MTSRVTTSCLIDVWNPVRGRLVFEARPDLLRLHVVVVFLARVRSDFEAVQRALTHSHEDLQQTQIDENSSQKTTCILIFYFKHAYPIKSSSTLQRGLGSRVVKNRITKVFSSRDLVLVDVSVLIFRR